jgi:hypothetical protein
VYPTESQPTFRRSMSLPSSGLKHKSVTESDVKLLASRTSGVVAVYQPVSLVCPG